MENRDNSFIIERIIEHVTDALFDARAATKIISNGTSELRAECGAVSKALCGLSKIHAAESLYLAISAEEEERPELEKIIRQYEVFVEEITNNLSKNHSHQWSHIEKEQLFKLAEGTMFEIKD